MEGIRRSLQSVEQAELVLHVLDASEPLSKADQRYLSEFAAKKRILVRNKIDLETKLQLAGSEQVVDVSSLTGQGIEALKDAIKSLIWSGAISADNAQAMINSRHQDALNRARAAALRAAEALRRDASLELAALDLRMTVNAIGEIVGKTATEDLLDSIFSQFCIGK
jgi:tRNA modification GTPase